jgi:glucan phosphorylase
MNSVHNINRSCTFREWRRKQAEEIAARDEASKKRQNETIAKAEKAIDDFYEDYAAKKERNIRENKSVTVHFASRITCTD